MAIIGAPYSLKFKLLSRSFKDAALRWYTCLSRSSINNDQELVKKLVHHFAASHHRKMYPTTLFNIRQGPSKSLRDSLAHFNEATIKVVSPNQEIFFRVFKNGFKERHFKESLAQKLALPLKEVVSIKEYYIKGKERNTKNKAHSVTQCVPNV